VMATDSTDYSQSISYSTSTAASRDAGGHGSIEENKSQLCVNTVSIVELIVDKQCELLCVCLCVYNYVNVGIIMRWALTIVQIQ